jgi:hypothetical protein
MGMVRKESAFGIATLGLILVLISLLVTSPAHAQTDGNLKWSATVAGRPHEELDSNQPLRLGTDDEIPVVLTLENVGQEELEVRRVRLNGRVMGLSFFSFGVRINAVLAPGQSTVREFSFDLDALSKQANGYIPTYLVLLSPDREEIGSSPFPVDVRGSAFSIYGLFGISVALVTLALLGSLLVSVYRGRLARQNRWQRALQFLPVGAGLGLTLTFTLSALRLLIPSGTAWLSLVLVGGGAAFLIGYFLPLGREDDVDDEDDDEERQREDGDEADQWQAEASASDPAGARP